MGKRIESDSLGNVEVASDKYWGAQTQRSIMNFPIGWEKQPEPIVRALGIVKRAAAETNMALGKLDETTGNAIIQAANEVIENIVGFVGEADQVSVVGLIASFVQTREHPIQAGSLDVLHHVVVKIVLPTDAECPFPLLQYRDRLTSSTACVDAGG